MTDQEIIERGLQAEALLTSDLFNDLFIAVKNDVAEEFLSIVIGDDDRVRNAHLTVNGMRLFCEKLKSYVLAKENVVARLAAEQNRVDNPDDYL